MSDTSMYIVIEYNQASGQPRIVSFDDLMTREEAIDCAAGAREITAATGRRERFVIARVEVEETADE